MTAKQDEPISQLFVSCDLTGSTNFKQRQGLPEPWQKVFLQFYREFPQRVATTQVEMGTTGLDFSLWKPVGDELIYSCPVSSEEEVYNAVRTWTKAMRDYETYHLDDTKMGTKGGAFIATFPGPDSRSSVPRRPDLEDSDADVIALNRQAQKRPTHSKYLYDYFGPSIDTGFRVIQRCSPRHFTLAVEVTLAITGIAMAPGSSVSTDDIEDVLLLDFVELKGVWGGKRYPIAAIDMDHDDPINRAYSKFERRDDAGDLHALCEACYRTDTWPSKLYLPKSGNTLYKVVPADPLAGHVVASAQGAEQPAKDEPAEALDLDEDAPLGDWTKSEIVQGYVGYEHDVIHGVSPHLEVLCAATSDDGSGPQYLGTGLHGEDLIAFDPAAQDSCQGCAAIWQELSD